jgi:hypothetical protein
MLICLLSSGNPDSQETSIITMGQLRVATVDNFQASTIKTPSKTTQQQLSMYYQKEPLFESTTSFPWRH